MHINKLSKSPLTGNATISPLNEMLLDLLQKHHNNIVKETCVKVIHKISEKQNYSTEIFTQYIYLAIELINERLRKGEEASLTFFINDLININTQTCFKLSSILNILNILKKVISDKLITENLNKPGQTIQAIDKINDINEKLILSITDNYQKHTDHILEYRNKEFTKQIEKATANMEKLEQFNENILQSMTSGLIVVDNKYYNIQKFNKAIENISGLSANIAIGKSLEEAFSYIEGIPFEHFYTEIKTKGQMERTKLKLNRKRGEEVYRYIKADALVDKKGTAIGIMIIIDDVTENEIIKESFSRYVAHQVVERILKGKEKVRLSGIRKEVTVVFADIRGFTSLSEKCKPETVVSILNSFFSLMVDIIFKYEGTLDKFIGDNIMSVFGAPVSHPNDVDRAVLAAIEMQIKTTALNKTRLSRNEMPLEIGIGINTGEAIAGNIGSEKRMDYTVIGDTVNFADRVQSKSKGGEILISESTFRKVREKISVKKLAPCYVKGKQKEVTLYKVIDIL